MLARLALVVLAAGFLAPPLASAADKRLVAEQVEVGLSVDRDGSMLVRETTAFRFEGGPFTSVTRVLSERNTDGIDGIVAALDGIVLAVGRKPGQVQIEREDGIRITWRFTPASNTTKVLVLSYRVHGVVTRSAAADTVSWWAVPARRSYAIETCAVRVRWPEGSRLTGGIRMSPGPAQITDEVDGAVLTVASGLPIGTGLSLALDFAPGSVTGATPRWQLRWQRGRAAASGLAITAGTILACGILWMLVFWIGHRHEPLSDVPARQTAPPDDLPAACAAALLAPGAGVNWSHALSTLVDLGRRGLVRVEEQPGRTWHGGREYLIHMAGERTGLSPHEKGLVDLLFVSKGSPVTSVTLTAAGRAAQSRLKVFKTPVGEELAAAGLVSPDRAQTRAALLRWAVLLVVVAAAGFAAAAMLAASYDGWPLLVPGSVMAVAVMILIMASQFSVLSTAGQLRAQRWRCFFLFVQRLAGGKEPLAELSWFEPYLPFAVARGIGHRWVARFETAPGMQTAPAWFTPAASEGGRRTPLISLKDFLTRARGAGVQKHAAA